MRHLEESHERFWFPSGSTHKKPVNVDFGAILDAEVNIVTAMGYPTEIFQVTKDITEHWERFSPIISHRFPFADVQQALTTASTPGAADKVVVTFESATPPFR